MDKSLNPAPLMAHVLPGFYTLGAFIWFYFITNGFPKVEKFSGLSVGHAAVIAGATFFAAWILGSLFDAIRNVLEHFWDSEQDELWWNIFFEGKSAKVEQLHVYYYSFYELNANFAIAGYILWVVLAIILVPYPEGKFYCAIEVCFLIIFMYLIDFFLNDQMPNGLEKASATKVLADKAVNKANVELNIKEDLVKSLVRAKSFSTLGIDGEIETAVKELVEAILIFHKAREVSALAMDALDIAKATDASEMERVAKLKARVEKLPFVGRLVTKAGNSKCSIWEKVKKGAQAIVVLLLIFLIVCLTLFFCRDTQFPNSNWIILGGLAFIPSIIAVCLIVAKFIDVANMRKWRRGIILVILLVITIRMSFVIIPISYERGSSFMWTVCVISFVAFIFLTDAMRLRRETKGLVLSLKDKGLGEFKGVDYF